MIQTIEFELAKWFKERGVKQDSKLIWFISKDGSYKKAIIDIGEDVWLRTSDMEILTRGCNCCALYEEISKEKDYPAFTLDEILEMLPVSIKKKYRKYSLSLEKTKLPNYIVYYAGYWEEIDTVDKERAYLFWERNTNAAQAAGFLLKWCIENGHVNIEEKK